MIANEYTRAARVVSGISASFTFALITLDRIKELEARAVNIPELQSLNKELFDCLNRIKRPEDYTPMEQAYETYFESNFYLEMLDRNVVLGRTPNTGKTGLKRPDFVYPTSEGNLYFELKAINIADPLTRNGELAEAALESAADLEFRAREPGVHLGDPVIYSGPKPGQSLPQRIDATIDKISGNIKVGQVYFGPTVLAVDMGRHTVIPHGPSNLLPVFFNDGLPAESCVSGELWQIAWGKQGEQLFSLPEGDGLSNLAGHQARNGIFHQYPGLVAITFFFPRGNSKPDLFTLWNESFDEKHLENPCTISEHKLGQILHDFSDGFNNIRNEYGWPYRVNPPRPK